ncbi:MAG: hypothetical protein HQM10_19635 [Candidatus Riflebacteria bacterium]|nr:hypothetical protein [Candidatus Riflebacteria bacterium]
MNRTHILFLLFVLSLVFTTSANAETEKNVGILYETWFNAVNKHVTAPIFPEDVTSPGFRYWGKPSLGIYRSDDVNAINVHARQLCEAGVDFIIIDYSNNNLNDETLHRPLFSLLDIYQDRLKRNLPNPGITFLINDDEVQILKLYEEVYQKYDSKLFFHYSGKPLLLPINKVSKSLNEKFTIRPTWGLLPDGDKRWSFMQHYPQTIFMKDGKPEQIAVSAAQQSTYMSNTSTARGRKWNYRTEQNDGEDGQNFDDQWSRAIECQAKFVIIKAWNEWAAQNLNGNFTDTFNQEFSNDIEPMKGGHGKKYYEKMKNWIAKYKGSQPDNNSSSENPVENNETPEADNKKAVTLYDLYDYNGDSASFGVGEHKIVGQPFDNKASSIKVKSGYEVVLYRQSGPWKNNENFNVTLRENVPNLKFTNPNNMNNKTTFLIVRKIDSDKAQNDSSNNTASSRNNKSSNNGNSNNTPSDKNSDNGVSPGTGAPMKVYATGYFPPPPGGYKSREEAEMEGGAYDCRGNILKTLEEYNPKDPKSYVSAATDPRVIKTGTYFTLDEFPGVRFYACDVGPAIKGAHIDICCRTEKKCYEITANYTLRVVK